METVYLDFCFIFVLRIVFLTENTFVSHSSCGIFLDKKVTFGALHVSASISK